MRVVLAIILLLPGLASSLWAQDLTGQWTGTAVDNITDGRQKLVLNISYADSSYGGVLHWYVPEKHYIRHLIVSGRFYGKDSILVIREDSVLNVADNMGSGMQNSTIRGRAGFYILYFKRINHRDILEGHWRNPAGTSHGGDLSIRLEKKAPPFIPVLLPPHKKTDTLQQKSLLGRESVVAARIPARGIDSVKVELYDNGEIDGDSVSLYVNGQLILQHLKLTAEAKTLTIPVDRSLPVNRITLFAENLGLYPPNTALMVVTVHGKTYNLFLSTDYKKNATVEFNLDSDPNP